MMNDEYFMNIALEEAKLAMEENEVPIGAVLVINNTVIAKAHNKKESMHDATAHAEILVIKEASKKLNNWRLLNSTLYVTLEPCAMCASAIQQARISRVVYAFSDPNNGAIENGAKLYQIKSINNPPKVRSGILKQEAYDLLRKFFRSKRNN